DQPNDGLDRYLISQGILGLTFFIIRIARGATLYLTNCSRTPLKMNMIQKEFRNIHVLRNLPHYKMPVTALVSILHRLSGIVLFLSLPGMIWLFEKSLMSEVSYQKLQFSLINGWLPLWLMKLMLIALIWCFLHHLLAGVRYLLMDIHWLLQKQTAKLASRMVLILGLVLTASLAWLIW
ncbi:MAG: succinate dehydrogenase, cytochrome b556 subunit, partial [Gammaproteobacteria bacterium]|nr:succinate dehydrogenase, cytochrome b556 subunit [Gammaproteobacteria bacterium]